MNRLILERFADTPYGTFGRVSVGGMFLWILELPWRNNEVGVSCIPVGTYRVERSTFNKPRVPYPCWHLLDVPGRTEIKIHGGNTMHDVVGCQIPGYELGWIRGMWGIKGGTSRRSLRYWLDSIEEDAFDYEIVYQGLSEKRWSWSGDGPKNKPQLL